MLWLAAASGLVAWEARRRTKARKAVIISEVSARTCGAIQAENLSVTCANDDYVATRSTIQDLQHALSCLQNTATCTGQEDGRLEQALLRGQDALPWLCNLLEASDDTEILSDASELLALLSPSRHGLQIAIYEAGAVPGLLRLLASPFHLTRSNDSDNNSRNSSNSSLFDGSATAGSGSCSPTSSNSACSIQLGTNEPESVRRSTAGSAVEKGPSGHPAAAVSAASLAAVLRTLVNLTSGTRGGTAGPVRQAVLCDFRAVAGLLQLLRIEEWGHTANPNGQCDPNGNAEDEPMSPCVTDIPMSPEPVLVCSEPSTAEGLSSETGQRSSSTIAAMSTSGAWQLAGLAAWLVAHLCSSPVGQLQLVREGVVPLLIRLVRHGRLVWTVVDAHGSLKASPSCSSFGGMSTCTNDPMVCGAENADRVQAGGDGVAAGGERSGAVPTGFSRYRQQSKCMEATLGSAEQHRQPPTGAGTAAATQHAMVLLQFVLSAVQYSLMALVNITFDNSAHQRVVAVAGGLEELHALFNALLSPGALGWGLGGARRPSAFVGDDKDNTCQEGCTQRVLRDGAEGSQEQDEDGDEDDGEDDIEGENEESQLDGDGSDVEEGRQQQHEELMALLRSCFQSVAKFAVWLLAHLSSSDPDLKVAISGPAFGFIPMLLSILTYPHHAHHPASLQSSPTTFVPSDAAVAAAMFPVRQYSAMALVNLTCGVPSTKAEVAAAVDWGALAAQLQSMADTIQQGPTAHPPASPAGASTPSRPAPGPTPVAAPAPHPGHGLTSDLLLYTVWLVQHVSLSPVAVAGTDPIVVGPLVALLAAPDPHVRLRTVATLGALCSCPSSPFPAARKATANAGAAVAAAAGQDADPSQGKTSQQQVQVSSQGSATCQGTHREAFLAAGGIERLLAVARAETDPRLLAYNMLCLSAAVGEDDADAVTAAVSGGALGLLERLMTSEQPACLVPAAEALQAIARAACTSLRHRRTTTLSAAAFIAESGADYVPRSLLSRMVSVMLTHTDPRVRVSMNEALGSITALPGVRDRYCVVFAETLRVLVSTAAVELQVIPVN